MREIRIVVAALIAVTFYVQSHQIHEHDDTALYLGNEGVMLSSGETKVLFDPFFHENFGIYQTVPEEFRRALFGQEAPYDGVNAIVISHAHTDHFNANDVIRYLRLNQAAALIAPQQAIDELKTAESFAQFESRIYSISLDFGDEPVQLVVDSLIVDVVRIPHAGWPSRADVENLVYRVSLPSGSTVMHMGDADPDVDHYLAYSEHWQAKRTNMAFPPYWFYYNLEGNAILDDYLNIDNHIGVHVTIKPPKWLIESGKDYFSEPGRVIVIETETE